MTYIQLTKVRGLLLLMFVIILISGCAKHEHKLKNSATTTGCVIVNLNVGDQEAFLEEFKDTHINHFSPVTILCESIGGKTSIFIGGEISEKKFYDILVKYNETISGSSKVIIK